MTEIEKENEHIEKETNEKTIQENSISIEKKDDNISELNQTFTEIIIHFSDFLSKHSVYEAAPENSKVLVFNSDLSFKEMVKAFINEDIYCALIYDSDKEFFIGLITISDILMLFKYIIEQTQIKEIFDYNIFIEEIFSSKNNIKNNINNDNSLIKDKNFDILKYLTKVNFNDYYKIIKKKKKIYNLISISLDASLLDVLKMIYKVGVHRLVVEETKKKNTGENKKKENEINNQNNQNNSNDKNDKKEENEKDKEKIDKEKNEKEKNEKAEKPKSISEKKIKKVKTKKKSEENVVKDDEVINEGGDGEKKVKKKKVKKKKTEEDKDKDKEDKEKDKDKEENKENKENKEEGEKEKTVKSTKKIKIKKKITEKVKVKKKKETEEEKKEEEKKDEKEGKKEDKIEDKKEEKIEEIKDVKKEQKKEENKDSKDTKNAESTEKQKEDNIKEKENEKIDEKELASETQNYTGFVTYETVFDFLIYNYYSIEMKEFNLTLEDLKKLPLKTSFIRPIENFALMNEEVHSSFSKYITSKKDLLPILTNDKNDLFGFLYLRDYLYFISNCESNQKLTNEEFLINMYEGIDDNKPFGKERIIYYVYDETSKKLKIKELLEQINAAPEKKIVLRDIEGGNKLYIISLNSIFDALVEKNKI